ncbi:MAG: PAS domain-containing protein [Chloroflexota bacterium]
MEHPSSTQPSPLAMLFTNAGGGVIFADRHFLSLAERSPEQISPGQALHILLETDPQSMSRWVQTVAREGFVPAFPLTLATPGGARLPLSMDGVAVYDELKRFIGADVLFAQPATLRPFPPLPLRHPDALATYFQQVLNEAQATRTMTFLQVYVSVQIEILQVLLARMGGPKMRQALESILNQTADRHQIPARMQQGYLGFLSSRSNIGHYRALLRAAFAYAVDAIGRRAVSHELSLIDQQMTPGLLPLVAHLDIKDILDT